MPLGGSDFVLKKTSLTIPSGTGIIPSDTQEFCVNVTIMGDDLREPDETFMVVFTVVLPDMFEGGANAVTITITDDGDGM